ncbi:MAG: hypothetical protein V1709_11505 [Planctomycetota bacterium]
MGTCRFLYDNAISISTMVSVSSLRAGFVTAAYKEGAGSAILNTFGTYTGNEDLEYKVEIDDTAAGREVGQAKYKWQDSDSAWDASSVVTSSTRTDSTMTNGVQISFTSGAGDDFVKGDLWYFKGINLFNPGKAVDLDRNSRIRSTGTPATWTITIDMAAEKEVKAAVIFDHNFSASVIITLQGDADTLFAGGYTTTIPYNESKVIHYLVTASTYQYWQIRINDSANTNGYLECSEIFLGGYFEPSGNFKASPSMPIDLVMSKNYTPGGVRRNTFYSQKRIFNLEFPYMSTGDDAAFRTLLNTIGNQDTKQFKPFYFHVDSADADEAYLCYLDSLPRTWFKGTKWTLSMKLEEALKKKL